MIDDAGELRDWIRHHTPQLLNVARAFTADADEAEDLLQETWITAHEKRHQLADVSMAASWLHSILLNIARSRWRRKRRRENLFTFWKGGDATHDETQPPNIDQAVKNAELWRAVSALPDLQRRVLLLRIVDDMSTIQAANAIGVAEGTVKASLHRALSTLRKRVEDFHG